MKRILVPLAILGLQLLPGCSSAEARLERGETYYLQGNYEQALHCYRDARSIDPTLLGIDEKIHVAEVRWCIQRGDLAIERRAWDAAERAYSDARRLDPDSDEVAACFKRLGAARANYHFQRGQRLLAEGNPFDALAEFEQTLSFQPDHPRAAEAAARARREKQQREERAETYFRQGQAAWAAGSHEDAVKLFTRALDEDPRHTAAARELREAKTRYVRILVARGDGFMESGAWAQAAEAFRKARENGGVSENLQKRLRRAEQEVKAEKLVKEGKKALEEREWKTAYDLFSEASRMTATPERFRSYQDKARDELAAALYTQAGTAEKAGNYEGALKALETLVQVYPRFRDANARKTRLERALHLAEVSYEAAVQAQETRDLQAAQTHLAACLKELSSFKDSRNRLAAVKEQLRRAQLFYDRAADAESRMELKRARILFEESLVVSKPFLDAGDRIAAIDGTLASIAKASVLYRDACRAQDGKNLELAQRLFHTCQQARPGYKDTAQRLNQTQAALAAAHEIRKRALQAESACQIERAAILFEECLGISNPCMDASARLHRIRQASKMLGEARKLERTKHLLAALEAYEDVLELYRCHEEARSRLTELQKVRRRLSASYQSMLAAQKDRNFRQSLTLALDIQSQCAGFKDVDGRIPVLESELDYAQALALEKSRRHAEAAELFQRCAERTPGFRDVDARLDAAENEAAEKRSK